MEKKKLYFYLLVKILWCEKEVVEWNKVSFQQTHQQHQINSVCKLKQHKHWTLQNQGFDLEILTTSPTCLFLDGNKNAYITKESWRFLNNWWMKSYFSRVSGGTGLWPTCVSSSDTSRFSLFRCLFTNVIKVWGTAKNKTSDTQADWALKQDQNKHR